MDSRNTWPFLLLCLIWGTTWIGIKAGLEAVPPLFLAGSRFSVAGAILSATAMWRGDWSLRPVDVPRLFTASVLMIAVCYGALFWGMRFVDSGTAAVLEMGLTPVALLVFALLLREERASVRKVFAIAMGIGGLCLLFGPVAWAAWGVADIDASKRAVGGLAVASAAVTYGWGSVVTRPLLRAHPPIAVSGATTLIGGLLLLVASLIVEPGAGDALRGDWGVKAWAGWLFLVLFGSLLGYSIYMRLLRDVGASQAGMYAFVSPVVAVVLGVVLLGETVTVLGVVGMAVMLFAAWLAMSAPKAPDAGEAS